MSKIARVYIYGDHDKVHCAYYDEHGSRKQKSLSVTQDRSLIGSFNETIQFLRDLGEKKIIVNDKDKYLVDEFDEFIYFHKCNYE